MPADELPAAPHTVADWFRGYEENGRLRGFRCAHCGLVTATWGLACPRCGRSEYVDRDLPPTGAVVAYTILSVPGDDFLNDAPYAYVVVELDGGGRVTGWMPTVRDPTQLAIGDRVRFHPGYKPGVQFVKESDAGTSA
ncbi:MAG TPA: OB-fold domain-containing protein [Thermoplasmata archaeon]|nr:OB-fold domain-containing protein [Thermoplasmata archaeon]